MTREQMAEAIKHLNTTQHAAHQAVEQAHYAVSIATEAEKQAKVALENVTAALAILSAGYQSLPAEVAPVETPAPLPSTNILGGADTGKPVVDAEANARRRSQLRSYVGHPIAPNYCWSKLRSTGYDNCKRSARDGHLTCGTHASNEDIAQEFRTLAPTK